MGENSLTRGRRLTIDAICQIQFLKGPKTTSEARSFKVHVIGTKPPALLYMYMGKMTRGTRKAFFSFCIFAKIEFYKFASLRESRVFDVNFDGHILGFGVPKAPKSFFAMLGGWVKKYKRDSVIRSAFSLHSGKSRCQTLCGSANFKTLCR